MPLGCGPYYRPAAAADWRHLTAPFGTSAGPNTFIRIAATCGGSLNDIWMDNLRIGTPTNLHNPKMPAGLRIVPNPARESAMLQLTSGQGGRLQASIVDPSGHRVAWIEQGSYNAGAQQLPVSLAGLAPGIYYIIVQTESDCLRERLTVLKLASNSFDVLALAQARFVSHELQ
jgi:hypothetical protein